MKLFFEMLLLSFMLISYYLITYFGAFSVCFSDDLEFYRKKRMKNVRKKLGKTQKGFLRKFLFLDIRKEVVPWHYAMFWVNLIASIVVLISFNVFIACGNEIVRIILLTAIGISFLTCTIIAFVRWPLYAGNKIRNRKEYRKKYYKKYRKK